jgi:diguanylate cyclase (GGDEF)-like protein/PAS domain S-box-containing protein
MNEPIMANIDLGTVLIGYIFGNLICAMVLFTLWRENRVRYSGLEYWMASFTSNFIGIVLLSGRGFIPDFFSMFLGSVLMVMGTLLLYTGVERFLLDRGVPLHIYVLMTIYVAAQAFYIYIQPNFLIRNVLFSTMLVLFSLQFTWLLFRKVDAETQKITRSLGFVICLFGLVAAIRIVINIYLSPGSDPAHSSSYEALIYLVFQMLYIVLTISLFTIVNRRLYFDLDKDITERKKTEDTLKLSQEKYSKAFKASPNAIIISRIDDGQIIELNDIFMEISGYSREEALGKSTLSLGIWLNPDERKTFIEEMRKNSRVRNYHFDVRKKNGEVIQAELSSEYIKLGDEDCMLSVIADISERKRMDNVLNLRLKMWDYSLSHTALEVMQKSLDEIEELTGSLIGFYHLVEEDSNSLTLQVWSTRTSKKFCKAESSGMHYSIDQAGVWVDCIRERKTVIHNNYAALPNRKGMPEGHATVTRELVVPIFQDEQIVSILGIGNKATDYDNKDVEVVEYIASLVWSIVSKMRADEKIQNLNDRLEKLAMSDELTSLPNRRYFFLRGNEEIKRSRRYHMPLSLIMLDIDRFKKINDSYGHDFGDLALKCVAKTLRDQCRDVDLPGRLGGEEFAILLPNTKLEEAVILAERIRTTIEELSCKLDDKIVRMTASLGVAAIQADMKNLDQLLHNADTAMYQAKNSGRNRVVLYEYID